MTTIYETVPLSLGDSTNIRLVTILFDGEETPNLDSLISCKLHLVEKLDKAADEYAYTALSYVWGNPAMTKSILLNGQEFIVRENLWNFLDQMRKEQYQGYLWIDAICIDQTQNDERSHQVAMMGQIYSKADKTLAWLGLQNEALAQMFEVIASNTALQDQFTPITKGLQELFQYEYWTRIWVVQEFSLSRSVSIRCGSTSLKISKLREVLQTWWDLMFTVTFKITPKNGIYKPKPALNAFRSFAQSPMFSFVVMRNDTLAKNYDLIEFVTRFAQLGCTDVRDRIYALLGLVGQAHREETLITPDYTQSRSDLFAKVLLLRLESYGKLGIKDFTALLLNSLDLSLDEEVLHSVLAEMKRRKTSEQDNDIFAHKQPLLRTAIDLATTYFRFGIGSRRPAKRVSERSIRFLFRLVAVQFPNVRGPGRRVRTNAFFRPRFTS